MKKFIAILTAVILVAGLGVGAYFLFFKQDNNPNSTMTVSVNPEIQFVLNKDNKVIYANATNSDGEKLLATFDFTNKSAEEVARMFVEISTESNYIKLDTTGATVTININAEKETEQLKNLQNKIKDNVNSYFKEIGVIGGAVVNLGTNVKEDLQKLGADVSNYADKTYAQIMDELKQTSQEVENVALSLRDGLFAQIDALRKELNMISLEDEINSLKAQIKDAKDKINNSEYISEATKKILNEQIETLEKSLNQAEKQLAEAKKEFNKKVDELIEKAKKDSEQILADAKAYLNKLIDDNKALIEAHKNAYQQNKAEIEQKIENFQNSLSK